jgi:hypothetical protein
MSLLGLKKRVQGFLESERGSVSILTIGLFVILLATCLVLTDISSIYLAKRSLTLATEAAVQRGMKNLDTANYYSGEYNLSRGVLTLFGEGESDPGIPIDCSAGLKDAGSVLESWQSNGGASIRENIESIEISDYACDGFQIYLETKARIRIPIKLPFINLERIALTSKAGAVGERADTNNYYGFDIG